MLAGEDAKAVEQLSRYEKPTDFLKAHNELRGKLSQRAEPVKMPDETTAPDDVAAYRKAFDVPEVSKDAKDEAYAEAYGLKLPEGVDVPAPLLGAFAKKRNSSHVPKAVVQKVIGEFGQIQMAMQQHVAKTDEAKRKEWHNGLRDKWGSKEYEGRLSAANAWLDDKFRHDEDAKSRLLSFRAPDGGYLADDPFFVELFSQLGMEAGHTDVLQANAFESGGKSIMEQIAEIEQLRHSNRAAYNERQPQLLKLYGAAQTKGMMDQHGNLVKGNQRRA